MKFNRWFLILIPILAILTYVSLPESKPAPAQSTVDSLASVESRKAKDENLKTAEDSPILNKDEFSGLHYYPFNPAWSILFDVVRAEKVEKIGLKMTDGNLDSLILFGKISATIQGKLISLVLYQHDSGDFFIPFKDKTAPTETYGGGRYVDLSLNKLKDKTISVDFNQAYFPYCAYNPTFTCPVPPKGNDIPTRIPAGERNF
jgi:uncharacterized protein (DUF1684 family)